MKRLQALFVLNTLALLALLKFAGLMLFLFTISFPATAGNIAFHDIAVGGGTGLIYHRVRSTTDAIFQQFKEQSIADPPIPTFPLIVNPNVA